MNFCVSSLRQALRGEGNINYIQRTPGGLSLALDFLGDHDVLPLQDSLQRGEALASSDPTQSFLSRLDALRLATQEVLTGCDMDWAETLRAKIHERLMEAGHFCLEFAEKNSRPELLVEVAENVLRLDDLHVPSIKALLVALGKLGNGEKVQQVYRDYCQRAQTELEAPPEPEIVLAYNLASRSAAGKPLDEVKNGLGGRATSTDCARIRPSIQHPAEEQLACDGAGGFRPDF